MAGHSALPLDLVGAALREPAAPAAQATPEQVLTAREQDVLALVAQGQTNKAIARVLEISPATVKVMMPGRRVKERAIFTAFSSASAPLLSSSVFFAKLPGASALSFSASST